MNQKHKSSVIIVGAGLSGLSAAKRLKEHGVSVLVLEARDRVGGRTYTKQLGQYGWLDVGASYIGPHQKNILNLADELGIKTYRVRSEGDCVFYFQGKALKYPEGWPHKNPIVWLDCNNVLRELDHLSEKVPTDKPWTAPQAEVWDHITVQQWLERTCWTRAAKEWGRQFVQSISTAEPWQLSFLWLLWYINSAGGVDSIWELDDAAQDSKFVGGTQQISEKLAHQLGDSVKLESPVIEIVQSEEGATVYTRNGDSHKCNYVIVAVPPWIQGSIHYKPELSAGKRQLLQSMPMGSCIKTQTYYKHAFWREKGFSGIAATVDDMTLIGDTIDDSRDDSQYPAITGFIMADMAQVAASMTKDERKQHTIQCYYKFFGAKEALEPVYYEDFNWMQEPYTGGCFTSICGPGLLTKFKGELRAPHGRVMFAGSETATQWSGYMDGAISAGRRAAGEVLHELAIIEGSEISPKSDTPIKRYGWFVDQMPSVTGMLTMVGVLCALTAGVGAWFKYKQHSIIYNFLGKYFLRQL